MSDAWVVFRPIDAVVFRDGRPFSAGLGASARTTFPRPSSTAGAMTAVFDGHEPKEIMGPLVVDLRHPPMLGFPSPADLVLDGDDHSIGARLSPVNVGPIVSDLDYAEDCPDGFTLAGGCGKPASALLTLEEMQKYLCGDAMEAIAALEQRAEKPLGALHHSSVLARERRLGLARDGRSARDGFLYAAEFLRFVNETSGFACRVVFDGDLPEAQDLVRLGGEARQAEITLFTDGAGGWLPKPPHDFPDGRLLVYLATPAIFTRGWVPDADPESTFSVVTAFVTGPEVAASWSVGKTGSNPVRWGVAAGSVYLLKFGSNADAKRFAGRWHGRCLPQADERLRTAGFGMCLIGRW